jgi:hypothetical protein
VSDDWRVRLVNQPQSAGDTSAELKALRDRLRSRIGKDITVTKAKAGVIFLYAATGAAAVSAQDMAREVLAELGTAADMRLERRDPRQQVWVVSAGGATVMPPGQLDSDRDRRLLAAGIVIEKIIDSAGTKGTGTNLTALRLICALVVLKSIFC